MRVKEGIELCRTDNVDLCERCPYHQDNDCMNTLLSEALAMIVCLEKECEFRREMQARMFAKLSDQAVMDLAMQMLKGE